MRRPSPAFVLALVALFVALGGPAAAQRAAKRISGARLTNNSVTSAKIRNGTLAVRDLSRGARTSLRTPADGSVDTDAIADRAVESEDIAANAVGGEEIEQGAVTGDELRDGGVQSAEVADGQLRAQDVAPYYGQASHVRCPRGSLVRPADREPPRGLPPSLQGPELAAELRLAREEAELQADELNAGRRR